MTKAKLRKLLTEPKFRAWLEGYGPRQIVGLAGCNTDCPIARFINMDLDNLAQWPRWMQDFVELVDLDIHSRITASRALRILDAIK